MSGISYRQRQGGIDLVVRKTGEGIPFVWGHSLMGSMQADDGAALWDWQAVAGSAQVIRYDARGHGRSGGSHSPEDYRWPELAAEMLAVGKRALRDSEWQRCVLGGISMGAATALEAAAQRPGETAGMILVIPPTAWETRPRQAAIYRRLAWVSGMLGAAPFHLLNLLPVPVREDGRSRLSLHVARGLARTNPRCLQAALRGAALSDMRDPAMLAKVDVPTLILAWEDDPAHPVSTAEELADCLPDVRALVVSDPRDISDWQPVIVDFLKEVTRRERKAGSGGRKTRKRQA